MRRWVIVLFLLTTSAPAAWAQQTPPPSTTREQKWEIEAFGGLPVGRFTSGGALTLPGPGAPITTSSPVFPSWRVPSWFFGDGAAFINNVAAEFGLTNRITPIDALLRVSADEHRDTGLAGVRLRRKLQESYSLEITVEHLATFPSSGPDPIDEEAMVTGSYIQTFQELLTRAPLERPAAGPVVSLLSGTVSHAARVTTVTAAISGDFRRMGGVVPYISMGGGVSIPNGVSALSIGFAARYRFQFNGIPFEQTDNLSIDYRTKTSFVGVIGGGLRWDLSRRWGIRGDARFLIGPNPTSARISARPETPTLTPAAFIESFTYPNLQFSNNPSTGRDSTLGGPELQDFEAFKGGWATRGRFTVGVFVKF